MENRFETFVSSVNSIYRSIQKIKSKEMTELGLRGPDVMCLFQLGRHPDGLTSAELSALCCEDKAAVSRAVTDMEAEGLILREGREDTMYRAVIRLTEKGQQAAEFVACRASAAVEAGGRGLSPKERDALQAALALIAANLETITQEGIPVSSAAGRSKP